METPTNSKPPAVNFTPLERQMISHIEMNWFLHGSLPTPKDLSDKFDMTQAAVGAFLNREETRKSLEARGMPQVQHMSGLLPEQVGLINQIMNLSDTRSERKKLSDASITPKVWDGWKQDPKVKAYMAARAEEILGGAIPDAHLALVDKVKAGDLGALKFYYEMTGRYTGQNQGIDPRQLLTRVFDIIAKHVQNPIALNAIAEDMTALMGQSSLDPAGNLNTKAPVAGEVVQAAPVASLEGF